MKTNYRKSDGWRVAHLTPPLSPPGAEREKTPVTHHVSRFTPYSRAFTLIELLVVIAIMGILAGLIFPVAGAVKRRQYINHTQAEMAQLETAIDRYKAAYGFYPPGSTNVPTLGVQSSYANQLYYELEGTVLNNDVYMTLDGSAPIKASDVPKAIPGVGGFMNCTKPGGGEDATAARNFLPELRPNQMASLTNVTFTNIVLVASVGGPDATYQPLKTQDLNPWRYVYPGINNPGSYDLWIQLSIGATTNTTTHTYGPLYLICNWTKQVQIGTQLP